MTACRVLSPLHLGHYRRPFVNIISTAAGARKRVQYSGERARGSAWTRAQNAAAQGNLPNLPLRGRLFGAWGTLHTILTIAPVVCLGSVIVVVITVVFYDYPRGRPWPFWPFPTCVACFYSNRLHPPRAGGRFRGENVRRHDAAAGHARVRGAERGIRSAAVFEVGVVMDEEDDENTNETPLGFVYCLAIKNTGALHGSLPNRVESGQEVFFKYRRSGRTMAPFT